MLTVFKTSYLNYNQEGKKNAKRNSFNAKHLVCLGFELGGKGGNWGEKLSTIAEKAGGHSDKNIISAMGSQAPVSNRGLKQWCQHSAECELFFRHPQV